jgi:hypothetical protein
MSRTFVRRNLVEGWGLIRRFTFLSLAIIGLMVVILGWTGFGGRNQGSRVAAAFFGGGEGGLTRSAVTVFSRWSMSIVAGMTLATEDSHALS